MELSREEEMQAYTDALGALATAVAWQIDAIRFVADLKALAHVAEGAGNGPSAGIIDALVNAVEFRVLRRAPEH